MAYNGFYRRTGKRLIDFTSASVLLIIMIPVYLIISLAILLEDGMPVLYRPLRGGYKNVPFRICKFRTMVKNAEKIGGGTTAARDPRITKTGRFLRHTKLDETANLINIILGQMSFVGPRPELLQYTEKYTGRELKILEVRPGITDYSSLEFIDLDEVVGETNADEMYEKYVLKKKNELRIKYAENVSFRTDAEIFFRTLSVVICRLPVFVFGKGRS